MSSHQSTLSRRSGSVLSLVLVAAGFVSAACGRGGATAQPQGPPPATGVQILKLENKPIEDASEFIATLRSLRSATVQPEIEGTITQIFVKSGQRVKVGTPLIQVNQAKEQAALSTTEANRAGTEADVTYWRQQSQRMESLVGAGAVSKAEYDQALNSLRTAEARLAALDAQVREGRVQLAYYRVVAPQSGTVGDITVRVGDRVTTSTMITTIDDGEALEAYIQVPLDRTPQIKLGLPVQVVDVEGKVIATNPISFVAPRVDDATQTVLVKSLLRDAPPTVRVLQFVRSRIVWRSVPGLTVPITSVIRIGGQYFCYVAESGPQGALVAKQRPITVGPVAGNDYVVLKGLNVGENLIVSGVQKIGDGAPVRAEAAASEAAPAAPQGK